MDANNLSVDPTTIIGEILGEPAGEMRNPVNADYQCPFVNAECVKRSQRTSGPYPVCSIWHGARDRRLICLCPKRFFEVDFLKDVIDNCWIGEPPANPRIAHEVQMSKFGTVDFVIADIDESTDSVREFVSVELQAVDISGSVEPAYSAVVSNQLLEKRPSFGINWANVRKRYINQLINKGIYHHHWKTRIISVIQTPLYNKFREAIQFDELPPSSESSNVVFMTYDFQSEESGEGQSRTLKLDKVVGTSHSSLMMAALYRATPPKIEFCDKIIERLKAD